jgi:ABC-type nickel/cobalt efflux system permease component RcnA
MRSAIRVSFIVPALLCMIAGAVDAHPLGNFTSNHLTRISVDARAVTLHYVLDDAEIPTFSLLRSLDPSGRPNATTLYAWAARHAAEIAPQLMLSFNGAPAPLHIIREQAHLRPGAAGLSTLYFTADYRSDRPATLTHIDYADATLPGRIGWRDVVVAPAHEPTDELRVYPNALIGSPRDLTAVAIGVGVNGALHVTAQAAPDEAGLASAGRMDDLSAILARDLGDPLVLFGALLLAIGLGALHALEPGHGKTLLAISLVGARATVPQAAILAAALTIAHTAGVLVFGVVVLTLARYIVPEALYPWIALASGLFVAALGARALASELRRRTVHRTPAHAHGHHHDHDHDLHHDHDHDHEHAHAHPHVHAHAALDDEAHARAHAIPGSAPLRFRDALLAAASGNVAPCPAALVVLLAAIATHRIGWGLVLIVAFSIGLALTLTGLGVAVVRGAAWLTQRPQFDRVARFAPLVTAGVISSIGAVMIGEAVAAQGIAVSPIVVAILVVAAIAAYSLVRTTVRPLRGAVA